MHLINRRMLVAGIGAALHPRMAAAQDPFIEVAVAPGVLLSLPRNWLVMSKDDRIDAEAYVEAMRQRTGLVPTEGGIVFAAFRDRSDGERLAWLTVRMDPTLPGEPVLGNWSNADKQKLLSSMDGNMARVMSGAGLIMVKAPSTLPCWTTTPPSVVTRMTLRDPNRAGDIAVQGAFFGRIPSSQHRLVVTANHLVELTTPFGPICDRIINSVRFG
jgi:hypothetical protein